MGNISYKNRRRIKKYEYKILILEKEFSKIKSDCDKWDGEGKAKELEDFINAALLKAVRNKKEFQVRYKIIKSSVTPGYEKKIKTHMALIRKTRAKLEDARFCLNMTQEEYTAHLIYRRQQRQDHLDKRYERGQQLQEIRSEIERRKQERHQLSELSESRQAELKLLKRKETLATMRERNQAAVKRKRERMMKRGLA